MKRGRARRAWGALVVPVATLFVALSLAGAGCAPGPSSSRAAALAPATAPAYLSAALASPPLGAAESRDRDLGPVPGSMRISVTLTLRQRNQAQLNALLARGGRVSPPRWAATFGPAPAQAAAVRRALARGGVVSTWHPGDVSLTVVAPAARLEHLFGVPVDRYTPKLSGQGPAFYAPTKNLAVPAALVPEVVAVTGMSNYHRAITAAIAGADGVTPAQVTSFYDLSPLRAAGLDGAGVTVLFPEWTLPDPASLNAFAAKFDLPAFDISAVTDPAVWGAPATAASDKDYYALAGEASMDVEIVHSLAPGAREIVYGLGYVSELPTMLKAMVTAHPGAIISSSIAMHWCEEEPGASNDARAEDAVFTQAAAEGTSIFWFAGDRGAFACLPDDEASTESSLAVVPDSSSPHVTSVGGTEIFLSTTGAYYKEAAWGEPIEQWGGGGGVSTVFPRPSWQQGPGTAGLTGRGDPDVSANADIESGWDLVLPTANGPLEGPDGGTSASTPFWAASTALIDEYLVHKGLPTIGFANPALYLFGADPPGMPAAPFHKITAGTNLHFVATAQWNEATGLGSPDVAHLADDFAWYETTHARGK